MANITTVAGVMKKYKDNDFPVEAVAMLSVLAGCEVVFKLGGYKDPGLREVIDSLPEIHTAFRDQMPSGYPEMTYDIIKLFDHIKSQIDNIAD